MRMSIFIGACALVFGACRQRHTAAAAEPKHLISLNKPKEVLYLDRLDNRVVMAREDTSGSTRFCTFLVGMRDSLKITDGDRKREREKYIQYGMQQDWTAIVGGDSVKPVFMQEKPNLGGDLRESALVFEIPRGSRADTLVYRDTYGDWGTQVFVLNAK